MTVRNRLTTALIVLATLTAFTPGATAQDSSKQCETRSILGKTADINQMDSKEGDFDVLLKALGQADPSIREKLSSSDQSYTLLAPTDSAFNRLNLNENNIQQADQEKLDSILKLHIVEGKICSSEIMNNEKVDTLYGEPIAQQKGILISDAGTSANLIQTDIDTSNGVIHIIDHVLMS